MSNLSTRQANALHEMATIPGSGKVLVVTDSVQGLHADALPADARAVKCYARDGDVWYTTDGEDPDTTAGTGFLIPENESVELSIRQAKAAKFLRADENVKLYTEALKY